MNDRVSRLDSDETIQPLDPALNAAILHIATRLFPCGFDVSDNAPPTYRQLKAHLDAGKRMVVYAGGCDHTIYADREINYAFRAWHDWCHWRGDHDFSIPGEIAVHQMHCRHLVLLYGDGRTTRRWRQILWAEVVGQRLYYETHMRYLADQRAFVVSCLAKPEPVPITIGEL